MTDLDAYAIALLQNRDNKLIATHATCEQCRDEGMEGMEATREGGVRGDGVGTGEEPLVAPVGVDG
jgi:hypothetical protein